MMIKFDNYYSEQQWWYDMWDMYSCVIDSECMENSPFEHGWKKY